MWQSPAHLLSSAIFVLAVGPHQSKLFVCVLNYIYDILLISVLLLLKILSLKKRYGTAIHVLDRNNSDISWYWTDVGELKIELVLYIANLVHSPTGAGQGAVQSCKNLHDVFSCISQTWNGEKQRREAVVKWQGKHQQPKQKLKKEYRAPDLSFIFHIGMWFKWEANSNS